MTRIVLSLLRCLLLDVERGLCGLSCGEDLVDLCSPEGGILEHANVLVHEAGELRGVEQLLEDLGEVDALLGVVGDEVP